jgi:hypothetical protein
MPDLKGSNELRAETQESPVSFLRTDLDVCSTFADIAEAELSMNRQHALEAFSKAERARAAIANFVLRVQDPTEQERIEQNLNLLQCRLAALSRKLQATASASDEFSE